MFMRLVQVKFKPESMSFIRDVYDKEIIPRLEKIEGCLCVCAIVSDQNPEEGISMTLWETPKNAKVYEKSGAYGELLQLVKPFLIDSSEWHVQLSKDMTLEYKPEESEPVIETYNSATQSDKALPEKNGLGHMYLRLVSVLLQSGKMDEFKKIYETDILPSLRKFNGCKFAFMTKSSEDENTAVCVSLWDSRQDAETYEKSGLFDQLIEKTKHTFSEFYRWKMALEKEHRVQMTTSDDMKIECFRVVIGKSFH